MIITLTGPSAGGKTTIVDFLKQSGSQDFYFPIGTTTRSPRVGEEEGVTYYFRDLIDSIDFVELNKFGKHYYGITKNEFNRALEHENMMIILDPNGVKTFNHLADTMGVKILNYYIHTDQDERLNRLKTRFINEAKTSSDIEATVISNLERFKMAITDELKWYTMNNWHRTLFGNVHPSVNIDIIKNDIKIANQPKI